MTRCISGNPDLTHKGDIAIESKAAVAGGVTSYMDMPNTNPQTTTQELLEEKYILASQTSLANYSFYMGATNDNLEELLKTDPAKCLRNQKSLWALPPVICWWIIPKP